MVVCSTAPAFSHAGAASFVSCMGSLHRTMTCADWSTSFRLLVFVAKSCWRIDFVGKFAKHSMCAFSHERWATHFLMREASNLWARSACLVDPREIPGPSFSRGVLDGSGSIDHLEFFIFFAWLKGVEVCPAVTVECEEPHTSIHFGERAIRLGP